MKTNAMSLQNSPIYQVVQIPAGRRIPAHMTVFPGASRMLTYGSLSRACEQNKHTPLIHWYTYLSSISTRTAQLNTSAACSLLPSFVRTHALPPCRAVDCPSLMASQSAPRELNDCLSSSLARRTSFSAAAMCLDAPWSAGLGRFTMLPSTGYGVSLDAPRARLPTLSFACRDLPVCCLIACRVAALGENCRPLLLSF